MKRINVPLLNSLNQADAQTASFILCADTNRHLINSVNWAGRFPYCPDSKFCIARSDNSLYVRFQILEDNLRALYLIDQEPVWEDSCVEFFCKKPQSDNYMNFEFNCIGTCVATTRKGRDVDVIPFSKNQMKQIDRFSSLHKRAFYEKHGPGKWDLTVKIPFEILGLI